MQSGRLIGKKGYDTTLLAFAELRKRFPEASLTILGTGPLEKTLRNAVKESGIESAVRFAGFIDEYAVRSEYAKAHLFVHPSRTGTDGNREGVPNAMLEAMATGLPVVATRHSGIPEAVDDGRSGWLVNENDHDALAERMIELLEDEETWRRMGRAAREDVEEKFEQSKQISVLEGVYRDLSGGHNRSDR